MIKCLYNFDILNFFLLFEQFLDGVFYFDIDNIVDYWISGVINEEKIMKNKNFSYIENFQEKRNLIENVDSGIDKEYCLSFLVDGLRIFG